MTVTEWFQIAAASIGIVGIATGAAVYTRSRLSFELLRGDLADSRARETDLRTELADVRAQAARAQGERDQLTARVVLLEDLATRAPDIAALATKVQTLTELVRSDYAHFAPALQLLVQEKLNPGARGDQGS